MSHPINTLIAEYKREELEGAYESYTCPACGCITDLVESEGEKYHWKDCYMMDMDSDDEYRNAESNIFN